MSRRRFIAILTGLALAATASSALAYYLAVGSGSGSLAVSSLGSPGPVVATSPSTGTAHVAWTQVAAPSGAQADVSYLVEGSANGGASFVAAGGTCAGTLSGTATSCDDALAVAGSYLYRVTATFATWTRSATSNSIDVVVAAATTLVFTTAPQTTAAGVASGLMTIQRQEANGTPWTTGAISVALSSSAATGVFRDAGDTADITSVTIANGSSTASFRYKDTVVGAPTITASSSGLTSAVQQQTVTAANALRLVLAVASGTQAAGATNDLTITAYDAYDNLAKGYTGTKSLTFGGATAIGTFSPTVTDSSGTQVAFGTATSITFTTGVATVSGANNGVMRLYRAETALVTVSDGAINSGAGVAVTVSAGSASTLRLGNCVLNGSSVSCGASFALGNSPGNVKANVEIFDAYGNVPLATAVSNITITSSNANYTVTGSPVQITGTGSPVNRSSTQFTVTHANNASNSATITVSATGFTSHSFTVVKN
ncbi:MAG: beta strand repeat-containing protein [Actinomycetota bacterium]